MTHIIYENRCNKRIAEQLNLNIVLFLFREMCFTFLPSEVEDFGYVYNKMINY
jgi:hypothetical protein